jgi:subtilisin family serine protease
MRLSTQNTNPTKSSSYLGASPVQRFSNHGASTVKLSTNTQAPVQSGESVQLSGTGAATPVVTAKAALLTAQEPNLSPAEVKSKLIEDSWGSLKETSPQVTVAVLAPESEMEFLGGVIRGNGPGNSSAAVKANPLTLTILD